jgi:ATP-dependent Lon protease
MNPTIKNSDPDHAFFAVQHDWEAYRPAADAVVAAAETLVGCGLSQGVRRVLWAKALSLMQAGAREVTLGGVVAALSERSVRKAAVHDLIVRYADEGDDLTIDEHDFERVSLVARLIAAELRAPHRPLELFSPLELFGAFDEAVVNADLGEAMGPFLKLARKFADTGARRLLAPAPTGQAFRQLAAEMPNFGKVVDFYAGQSALLRLAGRKGAQYPPVLLLGPPGEGKSRFATRLAQLIGSPWQLVSLANQTAGWVLSGLDRSWSSARPGSILTTLMTSRFANPVIVADEIDKASTDARYNPLGAFYSLLEADTAARFVDEFVVMPVNASAVIWIATANDATMIPGPLLSRLTVFEVERPDAEQARGIALRQFRRITAGACFLPLSAEVLEAVMGLSPREMGVQLRAAAGNAARRAVAAGKRVARVAVHDLPPGPQTRSIGFADFQQRRLP